MEHKTPRKKFVVLTAGGSGGHIFPAVALAEALKDRGYEILIITDERGRNFEKRQDMFDLKTFRVRSPSGNLWCKFKSAVSLIGGYFKALKLFWQRKPDIVVGFGGYPSFPPMLAAQHMGIRNIIHEQNAVIGKANLIIAKKADKIAISLPKIIGLTERQESRIVFSGNPVRKNIRNLYNQPYNFPAQSEYFNIFILGGSQGASVFSDVVPEALANLPEHERSRLRVTQQCRQNDIEATRAYYRKSGIPCDVETFFHDVHDRLKTAHLVIARSGASTVAEVTTAGRPAIFVPYPWHKDQQQKMNADVIADRGGAWVMAQDGFTRDALGTRLLTFLQDPGILQRAAAASKECAMPDAAEKLADVVESLIFTKSGQEQPGAGAEDKKPFQAG